MEEETDELTLNYINDSLKSLREERNHLLIRIHDMDAERIEIMKCLNGIIACIDVLLDLRSKKMEKQENGISTRTKW